MKKFQFKDDNSSNGVAGSFANLLDSPHKSRKPEVVFKPNVRKMAWHRSVGNASMNDRCAVMYSPGLCIPRSDGRLVADGGTI